MSGYENAPATEMLATRCACCGRPLVDALSVEVGMGPDCRAKYMAVDDTICTLSDLAAVAKDQALPEKARTRLEQGELRGAVNVLVHAVAIDPRGSKAVQYASLIRDLGFPKLAHKIESRQRPVIVVEQVGTELVVTAPFVADATQDWRRIEGRRFDWETKTNRLPANASSKRDLFALLMKHYAGNVGIGPRGLFTVPAA